MSLNQIAKNGPKTQFQQKWHFFTLTKKKQKQFFHKKSIFVLLPCQKNANFNQSWVFGPFLAKGLRANFLTWLENKKWFFSQKNHFSFSEQPVLVAGKSVALLTQNYFGKFCYCGPPWGIFIHGYFGCPGGPLSPCDSLLLGFWLFIQIHSETLWFPKSQQNAKINILCKFVIWFASQ